MCTFRLHMSASHNGKSWDFLNKMLSLQKSMSSGWKLLTTQGWFYIDLCHSSLFHQCRSYNQIILLMGLSLYSWCHPVNMQCPSTHLFVLKPHCLIVQHVIFISGMHPSSRIVSCTEVVWFVTALIILEVSNRIWLHKVQINDFFYVALASWAPCHILSKARLPLPSVCFVLKPSGCQFYSHQTVCSLLSPSDWIQCLCFI